MRVPLLIFVALSVGGAQYPGWWVPPGGVDEKSPLTATPTTIARGKELFAAHCARCHGPDGKGGGLIRRMRPTSPTTCASNMPAFEGRLEKAQVWALVEYLKVLRTPRGVNHDGAAETSHTMDGSN